MSSELEPRWREQLSDTFTNWNVESLLPTVDVLVADVGLPLSEESDSVRKLGVLHSGGGMRVEEAPISAVPGVRAQIAFAIFHPTSEVILSSNQLPKARPACDEQVSQPQIIIEFTIGDMRMPEGVQQATRTMQPGELAMFVISSDSAHRIPSTQHVAASSGNSDTSALAKEGTLLYIIGLVGWCNSIQIDFDIAGIEVGGMMTTAKADRIGHRKETCALRCAFTPLVSGSPPGIETRADSDEIKLGKLQSLDNVSLRLWVHFANGFDATPWQNFKRLQEQRHQLEQPFFEGSITLGVHPEDAHAQLGGVAKCNAAISSPFHDSERQINFPSWALRSVDAIMNDMLHMCTTSSQEHCSSVSQKSFADLLTPNVLHGALDAALQSTANVAAGVMTLKQSPTDSANTCKECCVFVEILGVDRECDMWHMLGPDLLQAAERRKLLGSAAFKRGAVKTALNLYELGRQYLDHGQTYKCKTRECSHCRISSNSCPRINWCLLRLIHYIAFVIPCGTADQKLQALVLRQSLLLNAAACLLKESKSTADRKVLSQVVSFCSEVINTPAPRLAKEKPHVSTQLQSNKIKAHYRRAVAATALFTYDDAVRKCLMMMQLMLNMGKING